MQASPVSGGPLGRMRHMQVDTRRFLRVLFVAGIVEVTLFCSVFIPRPPLTTEQWDFLEAQRPPAMRPSGPTEDFVVCADCLSFAVFRRGIGGWESLSASLVQLANLPAFLAAEKVFRLRQIHGSSPAKANSDLATIVLLLGVLIECATLALATSLRFHRSPRAA